MLTFDRRILVAATLAVLLLGSVGIAVPAEAARDLPIQLYGSRSTGWGLTNTSLSVPGPSLAVEVGDNVTLNLTSFDGNRHNWYIDYNSNSAVDANETSSSSPSTRGGSLGDDPRQPPRRDRHGRGLRRDPRDRGLGLPTAETSSGAAAVPMIRRTSRTGGPGAFLRRASMPFA